VEYAESVWETTEVGSYGTTMLWMLRGKYNAKFLHASTSECYGDSRCPSADRGLLGNVNPIGPRSVYDEAKRFSEAAHHAYPPLLQSEIRGSSASSTPTDRA